VVVAGVVLKEVNGMTFPRSNIYRWEKGRNSDSGSGTVVIGTLGVHSNNGSFGLLP